jgi:hypothetical protein
MDPRMKDGVRAHPLVLLAGMLLHLGIAAAGVCVMFAALNISPQPWARTVLLLAATAGAFGGVSLLVRRLRNPVLQAISEADDYVSNVLVDGVLALSMVFLLSGRAGIVLLCAAIALALYTPFGKIRHCLLFFVTRARFGVFIGRRGFPAGRSHS